MNLFKHLFILSILCLITSTFSISALAQMSQDELNRFFLNASRSGDVESVRAALEGGADVNVADEENGCTALMYATSLHEEWREDSSGRRADSPFICSRGQYNHEVLELLFDKGFDLNKLSQHRIAEFLLKASEVGDVQNVVKALEAEADVNGGGRYPPLLLASENGHEDIVRTLIIAGADINQIVNSIDGQKTALNIAIERGHEGVERVLRDAGALTVEFMAMKR